MSLDPEKKITFTISVQDARELKKNFLDFLSSVNIISGQLDAVEGYYLTKASTELKKTVERLGDELD